ncbi:MAG: hypothetical protein AAGE84_00940 [Cyanobacteria bacterium P01_G01_bin.39]
MPNFESQLKKVYAKDIEQKKLGILLLLIFTIKQDYVILKN